jgi:hypothetical protein
MRQNRKHKVYFLKNGLVRYWSMSCGKYVMNPPRLISLDDRNAMSLRDAMMSWSWTGNQEAAHV